jgi:hypothetical protein
MKYVLILTSVALLTVAACSDPDQVTTRSDFHAVVEQPAICPGCDSKEKIKLKPSTATLTRVTTTRPEPGLFQRLWHWLIWN